MKLPPELERMAKAGPDPLLVFEGLAGLPSITFNEYLAYEFLLSRFRGIKSELPQRRQRKLKIGFSEGSQLWVRWRGQPDDPRSMVLVSHVDREGFLVVDLQVKKRKAIAWHVTGEELEKERYGLPVLVHRGRRTYRGTIVGKVAGEHNGLRNLVELRLDDKGHPARVPLRQNDQFVGVAEFRIDPAFAVSSEGVISANSVDNAAGVGVVSAVMEGVARWDWPVNLDVLFTTCEEAGFCGVTSEILVNEELSQDWNLTWVVVDSSSQIGFVCEEVPESLRCDQGIWKKEEIGEVNPEEVVIRTGDKHTRFDPSVAFLLHAAALNSQRMLAVHKRGAGSKQEAKRLMFCELERTALAPLDSGFRSFRRAVGTGRMVGGWCEATPLVLSSALRGTTPVAELRRSPRVGSLAIPLSYYRNTFRGELKPEQCHVAAVMRACNVLAEAIRLHHRWVFADFPREPLSGSAGPDKVVRSLRRWHEQYQGLAQVTASWVSEQAKASSAA